MPAGGQEVCKSARRKERKREERREEWLCVALVGAECDLKEQPLETERKNGSGALRSSTPYGDMYAACKRAASVY